MPAHELVPGDIVLLEAGNLVPADGRVIETANLRVQEAVLTGESEAVEKAAAALWRPAARACAGRPAQHGLHGHDGHLRPRADGRGGHRHGDRAGAGRRADPGGRATQTPLQRRLDQLGARLAIVARRWSLSSSSSALRSARTGS